MHIIIYPSINPLINPLRSLRCADIRNPLKLVKLRKKDPVAYGLHRVLRQINTMDGSMNADNFDIILWPRWRMIQTSCIYFHPFSTKSCLEEALRGYYGFIGGTEQ